VTSRTATWNLPYQDGTDPGCDYAPIWCELVSLVDAALTSAQDAVSLATVVPMAKMINNRTLTPGLENIVQTEMAPIDMALEVVDTDNMIDLATDSRVNPPRTGIFLTMGYLEFFAPTTAGSSKGGVLGGGLPLLARAMQTVDNATVPSTVGGTSSTDPQTSLAIEYAWQSADVEGTGVDGVSLTQVSTDERVSRVELMVWRVGDLP
jgi:hypothetical protein